MTLPVSKLITLNSNRYKSCYIRVQFPITSWKNNKWDELKISQMCEFIRMFTSLISVNSTSSRLLHWFCVYSDVPFQKYRLSFNILHVDLYFIIWYMHLKSKHDFKGNWKESILVCTFVPGLRNHLKCSHQRYCIVNIGTLTTMLRHYTNLSRRHCLLECYLSEKCFVFFLLWRTFHLRTWKTFLFEKNSFCNLCKIKLKCNEMW